MWLIYILYIKRYCIAAKLIVKLSFELYGKATASSSSSKQKKTHRLAKITNQIESFKWLALLYHIDIDMVRTCVRMKIKMKWKRQIINMPARVHRNTQRERETNAKCSLAIAPNFLFEMQKIGFFLCVQANISAILYSTLYIRNIWCVFGCFFFWLQLVHRSVSLAGNVLFLSILSFHF